MTLSPAWAGTEGARVVLWSTSRMSPVGVLTWRCSWAPTWTGSAVEGSVEGHLDTGVAGDDVMVKGPVVGRFAPGRTSAGGQQEDANQR